MAPDEDALPSRHQLVEELRQVRRVGILRCANLALPALRQAAVLRGPAGSTAGPSAGVEALLRSAVGALGEEEPGRAAQYLFGLVRGTAGRRPTDLRRAAAEVFGLSPETFRKHHEPMLIGRIAEEILRGGPAPWSGVAAGHGAPGAAPGADPAVDLATLRGELAGPIAPSVRPVRRYGPYRLAIAERQPTLVSVDCGPVEALVDVDLLVSSENTYLLPARPFSATLSGGLRRAMAIRGPDGGLIDDVMTRELGEWLERHGRPGGPVDPGVVAVTSPGTLRRQSVVAVLHAAIAVPREDRPGYEVSWAGVSLAVTRCFDLARELRAGDEGVGSIAVPLFGAGDGGLSPEQSAEWMWSAVRRELCLDPGWRVHLTTWTARETCAVLALLASTARA